MSDKVILCPHGHAAHVIEREGWKQPKCDYPTTCPVGGWEGLAFQLGEAPSREVAAS